MSHSQAGVSREETSQAVGCLDCLGLSHERNHVELRKLLPKGRGIDFDALDGCDIAELMSQLNSEPRRSLLGASPITLLKAAVPESEGLLDALGVRKVPFGKLEMTPRALERERAGRGLAPLL